MDKKPIFYTGGAVPPDYPCYIERIADREAARILRNDGIVYTMAPRQMGKTSLLMRLEARLKLDGWSCCRIDLATFKGLSQQKWFRQLAHRIVRACGMDAQLAGIEDQQDFRDSLLDTIGLAKPGSKVKLALLLDEVEGLLGLEHSDEFLMTLRDLYQNRHDYPGQLALVFTGAVDPNALVKDPTISPFNVAHEVILTDFSADECETLTLKLGDLGVPMEKNVHQHIYSWTSGQPYLTQRLCEVVETWIGSRNLVAVSPSTIDDAVRQGLLNPEHEDKNIKHVKSSVARLSSRASALWLRLRSGQSVLSTEPGYYALYLTGAAVRDPEGQVRIRNRIYAEALGDIVGAPPELLGDTKLKRQAVLQEEHEAAYKALSQVLDPIHEVRLQRRIGELEKEIQEIDNELTRT